MLNTGSRSVFVDVARAAAIMMMVQGHTLHVVLATDLRSGTAFYVWSFLRGLTSSTFLLLSGFVFALATHRHWTDQFVPRAATGRRFRRLGFFLLLGYALHFPMAKLGHLYGMSDERWESFFVVDVLQCIAVMLATLQVLVWLARTPQRHTTAAAVGSAAIIALTPTMWRIDWAALAPTLIAAYLSPATGSPFPLFPWGAYILLGAAIGGLYVRSRMDPLTGFADRVLIGGGLGMLLVAFVCVRIPLQPFGPTDFWTTSPNQFLVRAGCVLLALGLLARISPLVSKPAYAVQALAHESLTVYAVHLGIVYGSAWNPRFAPACRADAHPVAGAGIRGRYVGVDDGARVGMALVQAPAAGHRPMGPGRSRRAPAGALAVGTRAAMDPSTISNVLGTWGYPALLLLLILTGIGSPIPEDLLLLTAGYLVYVDVFGWPVALAVCITGVVASDLMLYVAGRHLAWHSLRLAKGRLLSPQRLQRTTRWFGRLGDRVVFIARLIPEHGRWCS